MKAISIFIISLSLCSFNKSTAAYIQLSGSFNSLNPSTGYTYTAEVYGLPDGAGAVTILWDFIGKEDGNNPTRENYAGAEAGRVSNVRWSNTPDTDTPKKISVSFTYWQAGSKYGPTGYKEQTITVKYIGPVTSLSVDGTNFSNGQTATKSCGTSSISLSVPAVATEPSSAVTYYWTFPAGWSPSSATTSSPSTSVTPSAGGTGDIVVQAKRNDGTTRTAMRVSISRPLPVITSIDQTNVVLCSGQTKPVSATGTNYDKFEWTPSSNVRVNGNASVQIVSGSVNIGAVGNGTYTVKAYSTACAVSSSNSLTGNVRFGPPVIGYPVMTLMDAGSNMYQLSYDNSSYGPVTSSYSVISGSASLIQNVHDCYASSTGGATVRLASTNACGTGYYDYIIPAGGSYRMAVFPNPASESLTVEFTDIIRKESLPTSIVLFDNNFRKAVKDIDVASELSKSSNEQDVKINMDLRGVPRGTYYLHLTPNKDSKEKPEKIKIQVE